MFQSLSSLTSSLPSSFTRVFDRVAAEFDAAQSAIAREEAKIAQKAERLAETEKYEIPPWLIIEPEHSILQPELEQRLLDAFSAPEAFLVDSPDFPSAPLGELWLPVAKFLLETCPPVKQRRYELVPRKMSEEKFWSNLASLVEKTRRAMKVGKMKEILEEKQKQRISKKLEEQKTFPLQAETDAQIASGDAAGSSDALSELENLLSALDATEGPGPSVGEEGENLQLAKELEELEREMENQQTGKNQEK